MKYGFFICLLVSGVVNAEVYQAWSNVYQGIEGSDDQAQAIAVDDIGNVYVTGRTGLFQQSDIITIKYDSAGNQLWVAEHAGTQNANDRAIAIEIDPLGDIVVIGTSHNYNTGFDITLLKYNSDHCCPINYNPAISN